MHFIEEAVLNSFILHDKFNPGKPRFMQFKLNIVKKTINRAKAINIPQINNVPQVSHHFLEQISATEKKSNPQKKCVVCTKKKIRKKSVKQQHKPSWTVSSALFQKVSFLLDFIWA